jgi:hypothetical protein
LLVAAAFVLCQVLLAPPSRAADLGPSNIGNFDGTWQGVVYFDKEALLKETSTPAGGAAMRIDVHDPVVRVYFMENNVPTEVNAGTFHFAPVETNAVIFGTEESPKDGWVETWTFVVTQKDSDTLLVQYVRVVNNIGTPLSDENSKFATRGQGEFKRIKS